MDGYALRAEDTPGGLPVVFRIAAGVPAERSLAGGEAMAISTGGAVPAGADAVVPIEVVVEVDNRLTVPAPVERGANVRPVGGDVRAGDLVLAAGMRIGAAQIGALAAAGAAEVMVTRRPKVVVLSTGTELRAPGETLAAGQIYESNSPMLAAAFAAVGAEVERIGPVADDEGEHRRALEDGLEADVLVTSGGVSVGPHDLVRRILAELGVEEDFWGVAVRPGKPLAFGVRGHDARLRAPGQPGLRPRRGRAVRPPGAAGAAGRDTIPGRRTRPPGSLRPCAGTPPATSSPAPARGATPTGRCSNRSAARSRT